MTIRVAVLADTHVRDIGGTNLPEAAWSVLSGVDVILHAGDITGQKLLDELQALAPVHAVRGNNDTALSALPETCELELERVHVSMIHDSGPRRGREARLHRRFPRADLIVFGHSHIPWDTSGIDGQRLFNPGSATLRRRQPHRTMGVLTISGRAVRTELLKLP